MALKFSMLKFLRRPIVIRVIARAIVLVLAVVVLYSTQMAHNIWIIEPSTSDFGECSLNMSSSSDLNVNGLSNSALSFTFLPFWAPVVAQEESDNLAVIVFKYLMTKNYLQSNTKSLCIGEGSSSAALALRQLGLFEPLGVDKHPFFSLLKRRFVYELNFEDSHFDFVFTRNLDRASIPALLLLEIERVLRPGGTGAMLLATRKFYLGSVISSAANFASFLRSSDVIHSCSIGSYSLIIFQKRTEKFASFEHFELPADCPSVHNNKRLMKYIEPLKIKGLDLESSQLELSYLPRFMNISSRNKLIYINIGAGELARSSIAKISKRYNSNNSMGFDKFVVHYIPSIVYSYIPEPGINLVFYRPPTNDTKGPEFISEDQLDEFMDEEDFDLVSWLKETASVGNFVILMMNANSVELNILEEMFKTGAICYVDELFLHCSDTTGCLETLKSLRNSGVYVHQQFI